MVGVPKTIDNDVAFVSRSFGYLTAVEEAAKVLHCAHTEAHSVHNGIALVKLMGRDSGFIAAYSALANNHVNFCLVPEVPFTLERFLPALAQRLEAFLLSQQVERANHVRRRVEQRAVQVEKNGVGAGHAAAVDRSRRRCTR